MGWLRDMERGVVIAGRNAVREALEREPLHLEKVLLQRGARGLQFLRGKAARAGVPVQEVPTAGLVRLAGNTLHQGALALRTSLAYHDCNKMLARIAPSLDEVRQQCPRLLLLDGVQDPRNFGSVVRTAVAAGVAGIIVPQRRMAPVSTAMIKASSGTASRIPIARVNRLADVIPSLQERGFYIYGASGYGTSTMWEVNWNRPIGLVLGGEGSGLRTDTERACDVTVSIPMSGDSESLNVAVAAGVLLFGTNGPTEGDT